MKNLTKLTTSGLFASWVVFASKASAAGTWGTDPGVNPTGVTDDFEGSVQTIVNYILGFMTIVATLMIIYGGVLYLTSAGNEDSAARAKRTIAYGVVGLIVIGIAYALVVFITGTLLPGTGGGSAA
jgi:hypothetical protein